MFVKVYNLLMIYLNPSHCFFTYFTFILILDFLYPRTEHYIWHTLSTPYRNVTGSRKTTLITLYEMK